MRGDPSLSPIVRQGINSLADYGTAGLTLSVLVNGINENLASFAIINYDKIWINCLNLWYKQFKLEMSR